MSNSTYKTAAGSFTKGMGAWIIATSDIEAAIEATQEATGIAHYFMLESDDIVAVAKLWAKNVDVFVCDAVNEFSDDANNNSIIDLKNWFEELYKANQSSWNQQQKDAWSEIYAYKTFIQGLKNDEYSAKQLTKAGLTE